MRHHDIQESAWESLRVTFLSFLLISQVPYIKRVFSILLLDV